MKVKLILLHLYFALIMASCLEEPPRQQASMFKADIVDYLSELKSENEDDDNNKKIDFLIQEIDFHKIEERKIRGGERILVAETNTNYYSNDGEVSKVLFFVNQGQIVRSHIITFDNKSVNHNDLIVSFFNYEFSHSTYSGRISLFSTTHDIQLYGVFENGGIRESGIISGDWSKIKEGKTNSCIDWYLVTTYYLLGGGKYTTERYLFTTCDCDSQTTRVGKVSCAGGPGGSIGGAAGTGNPSFPSYPQNGEVYEFRDPDGKLTRYKYNSQSSAWAVEYVLLPDLLVQSQPQTYSHLLTDSGPYHGLTVVGPDNLLYTFDAAAGGWIVDDCIQNQLVTPCLSNVTNKVLDPNRASTFNNLIQNIFNRSDKVNLIIKEGSLSNQLGKTGYANPQNGIINVTITLDPAKFTGTSQEFLGALIYHECFHAVVDYLSNGSVSEDTQHIALYTTYLNLLADALQTVYPNMLPGDAKGLLLKGLVNLDGGTTPASGYWKTSFVNKILSSSGFTRTQVANVHTRYQVVHTSGTPCN